MRLNASDETAVLDPVTFITGRVAVGLDELGIHIREAEWGDADQEVFYVRQELGEIPGDRHPPNRTVVLKLVIAENRKANINLAEVATRLQQKVGVLQREQGWVMRSFSTRLRARVDVGFEVYNAVLAGIQGWLLGHHQMAHEVTLTLTCSPYCYGTEEIEGTSVETSTNRAVEWVIEKAPGTAPGKLRLRVKNQGTSDWLGMYESAEQVETRTSNNKMIYPAEDLTPLGSAVEAEKTGAVSGEVIKATSPPSTYGWFSVISSRIFMLGHMTHVGGRRILVRLYNTSTTPEALAVRLQWRSNSGEWETNEEVFVQISPGWQIVDLGEAISHQAQLGTHKFEFKVQMRITSFTQVVYAEFDQFYILSQSQFVKLRKGVTFPAPTGYTIQGTPNPVGTSGEALNGKSMLAGGGKWETSGSLKGDFLLTGKNSYFESVIRRNAVSDTERRKAFVSSPTMSDGIVTLTFPGFPWLSGFEGTGTQMEIGLFMHGGSIEAILKLIYDGTAARWELILKGAHIESQKSVPSATISYGYFYEISLYLGVVGSKAFVWTGNPETHDPLLIGNLTNTTAGKVGMFHYYPKPAAKELGIYAFTSWEVESEVLVNAGRLFDIGSTGTFRQDWFEDNWGVIPPEEGFYPSLIPAGLEQRVIQGILVPSNGDLANYDDSGTVKPKVTPFYRPAYHFMSEAG